MVVRVVRLTGRHFHGVFLKLDASLFRGMGRRLGYTKKHEAFRCLTIYGQRV